MRRSDVDRMSVPWITRVAGDGRFEATVRLLLERPVPQAELEEVITRDLGLSGKALQTARMNLIAGLRWRGYEVTGGRRGQKIYQILGWSKPKPQNYEEHPRDKETARWVSHLNPFQPAVHLDELIRTLGKRNTDHLSFENCIGYVLSYGLTAQDIFWGPYQKSLIFRRNPHHPRYSVMALDDNYSTHIMTGERLVGTRPVTVFNLHSMWRNDQDKSVYQWKSRRQVLYDPEKIGTRPQDFLSKTQMSLLRKLEREVRWENPIHPDLSTVIDRWAQVNKKKHPQIALGRDYTAIDQGWWGKPPIWGGYREADELRDPVCFSVFDILPNNSSVASHLVEKSLNYRVPEMPGGHSGMSDFNLVQSCRTLFNRGVVRINGGQYQSIGQGLAHHKQKWASEVYRAYEVVLDPGELDE